MLASDGLILNFFLGGGHKFHWGPRPLAPLRTAPVAKLLSIKLIASQTWDILKTQCRCCKKPRYCVGLTVAKTVHLQNDATYLLYVAKESVTVY